MAPIPPRVPLERILNHKKVRDLNCSAMGAYLLLLTEILVANRESIPKDDYLLMRYGHVLPTQWYRIKEDVLIALNATLPVVKPLYQKWLKQDQELSERARKAGFKGLISRRAKKESQKINKGLQDVNGDEQNAVSFPLESADFSDTRTAPTTIQPLRPDKWNGNGKFDMQKRREVTLIRNKLPEKGKFLFEKPKSLGAISGVLGENSDD